MKFIGVHFIWTKPYPQASDIAFYNFRLLLKCWRTISLKFLDTLFFSRLIFRPYFPDNITSIFCLEAVYLFEHIIYYLERQKILKNINFWLLFIQQLVVPTSTSIFLHFISSNKNKPYGTIDILVGNNLRSLDVLVQFSTFPITMGNYIANLSASA